MTQALETYDVTGATRPIADFVDELSNWYVRLSRRRFWNTGEGDTGTRGHVDAETREGDGLAVSPRPPRLRVGDSLAAHQTMYEVLVTLSHLLAPFTPFIADEIYRNLVCCGNARGEAPNTQSLVLIPHPSI